MRGDVRLDQSARVEIRSSEVESQASGINVGRIAQGSVDLVTDEVIRRALLRSPHDLVILRHSSDRIGLSAALNRDGLKCIQADTLLYFEFKHPLGELSGGSQMLSDAGDLTDERLTTLTTQIFQGYRNHYSASPELARISVEAAYEDWVLRSREDSNCRLWTLNDSDLGPCALALTERSSEGHTEILLAGVIPEVRRLGVYSRFLRSLMDEELRSGIPEFRISTQSANIGVMRAWTKLGFLPYLALNTLHVTKSEE